MPRRKRTAKRHVSRRGITFAYLSGDSASLGDTPERVLGSSDRAREAWPTYRSATWLLWAEIQQTWPPAAATSFDCITGYVWHPPEVDCLSVDDHLEFSTPRWPDGTEVPSCSVHPADGGAAVLQEFPAYVAEAARRDLENLEMFRREHPAASVEIAEQLATIERALMLALDTAIAEAQLLRLTDRSRAWS